MQPVLNAVSSGSEPEVHTQQCASLLYSRTKPDQKSQQSFLTLLQRTLSAARAIVPFYRNWGKNSVGGLTCFYLPDQTALDACMRRIRLFKLQTCIKWIQNLFFFYYLKGETKHKQWMSEEHTYKCKDGISPLMWGGWGVQITSLILVTLSKKVQASEWPMRPGVFVCTTATLLYLYG